MRVINFFGGPGCGKSTTAAGLFHHMKRSGCKVELVTEYAKDMVYEARANIMADQLYVLAKQGRRVSRLQGHVDYVITDSPLLLSIIYNQGHHLVDLIAEQMFYGYDNVNILLRRDTEYQEYGRGQTKQEASSIDVRIRAMLERLMVPYTTRQGSSNNFHKLMTECL